MLMIGGRNYRPYFEAKHNVVYYPTAELYYNDIEFPETENLILFIGSLELSKRYRDINENYSKNMLVKNLSKFKNKSIIFISSSAVYGLSSAEEAFTTYSQLCGVSDYAREKINLEILLASITKRLIILRPSGFFGEIYGFKPKSFLNSLSEKISLGLSGNYDIEFSGLQLRDFTHVKDLMRCIEYFCCIEISSIQCHNVSSTKPIKLKDLTKKIAIYNKNICFNYILSDEKKIHSYLENSKEIGKLLPKKKNIDSFLGLPL